MHYTWVALRYRETCYRETCSAQALLYSVAGVELSINGCVNMRRNRKVSKEIADCKV